MHSLTPRLVELRNVLNFVRYLTIQSYRDRVGALVERGPDGEWDAWPVRSWSDAEEIERR